MSAKSSTSDFSQSQNSSSLDQSANNSADSFNSQASSHSYSSQFIKRSSNSFNSSEADAESEFQSTNDDDYMNKISSNANRADDYFHQIDSVSSNMVKNSAGISSAFNKMNMLNERTGLNGVTLADNQLVNDANQSVAIDMIKVNNQKIKALAAKNKISGMSFKVKLDYKNYLRAQKAIKTDVTGINTHMSNSSAVFGQGINTLNSHNSLVTSYANQLSLDIDSADQEVSNASFAASAANDNESSASSAYYSVSSLVNRFQQQVVGRARSNAGTVDQIASQAANLFSNAQDYNQQIHSIANSYSNNASIASASNLVKSGLQTINTNHQYLSSTATSALDQLKQIDPTDVASLGADYRNIHSAATRASSYQATINSANYQITSAASVASSIADQLYAERAALHDGANAYEPVSSMPSLNPEDNTATYIKFYKQGYQKASQGFTNHINKVITGKQNSSKDQGFAYRIGLKNADYFIKGINDARKRVIKNNKLIDVKHYNFGYNAYRKLINNSLAFNNHKGLSLPLNQSLLLVLGFLVGYNS